VQVARRTLRMLGRREDEALLVLQHGEPRSDVRGIVFPHVGRDAEVGAKECRTEFRDEFLERIAFVAVALSAKVLVSGRRMNGAMTAFPAGVTGRVLTPLPWPKAGRCEPDMKPDSGMASYAGCIGIKS